MRRIYLILAMAVLCLSAETAFAQSYVWAPAKVDGTDNDTIDFGFIVRTFFIGDFVWKDDGDGIQSDEERLTMGISGVEVILFSYDGSELKRNTTNATGYYYFGGLHNGDYEIRIPMDQPALKDMTNTTPNAEPDDRDSDGIPNS